MNEDGDDKYWWKLIYLTSKWSKNENPEKSRKFFLKSRDQKYWKIPSRKIPGSRDLAKSRPEKSRDWKSWSRWGLVTSTSLINYQKGIIFFKKSQWYKWYKNCQTEKLLIANTWKELFWSSCFCSPHGTHWHAFCFFWQEQHCFCPSGAHQGLAKASHPPLQQREQGRALPPQSQRHHSFARLHQWAVSPRFLLSPVISEHPEGFYWWSKNISKHPYLVNTDMSHLYTFHFDWNQVCSLFICRVLLSLK